MEELEDIDSLINDVVVGSDKRENAAQIKIKTFANNFANIGNIGEEQRKNVPQTTMRNGGGETNGHVCPPSPSPSPPPGSSKRPLAKRSCTSSSKSTDGTSMKRRRTETSSTCPQGGFQTGDGNVQNGLEREEETEEGFHKSCLFFPHDVHLIPKERVDVTFEVTELLHVKVAVEVKSCFSFSHDRSLLSASKRKQLVHSCTIDAEPSQTVLGGRVTAGFTNTQTSGALVLAKGMKIGVCRFQIPKLEVERCLKRTVAESSKFNTSSIDSADCATPTQRAEVGLTHYFTEEHSTKSKNEASLAPEEKKPEGFSTDTSLFEKALQCGRHIKSGCESTATLTSSSNRFDGDTLLDPGSAAVSTTVQPSIHDSDNADSFKHVREFTEDFISSKSEFAHDHLQEFIEEKKFNIKQEDLKDSKCPDLFLENIRAGMPALEYSDPDICGFVDLYFAWCQAEGTSPTSEEGDELLQQVSMLDTSLEDLMKVLKDNFWSGEKDEEEWKEVFGQKFSLVQSGMLPELGKILSILLLDFKTKLNIQTPQESVCPDADSVAKKVEVNELGEADKAAIKEAVMINAEKQLEQLRKENEKLVAVNEQMAAGLVAANEKTSRSSERRKPRDVIKDQRPSAASFFDDAKYKGAEFEDEFELTGATGRVEDYLPKKHVFKVVCEEEAGLDILLASKCAEMFLGKEIQFDAKPLKDWHHKVFVNEHKKEGTYRVTKIYSSKLNDIDSEQDLLSKIRRQSSEGSSSLVSSSTDVVRRIKEQNEDDSDRLDTTDDYRPRREVDVKWKIQRMPKDCNHYVLPRFCKFKQCDGKCGDQHEFTSLQHKILVEDVGSYCFRFPKFTCHKAKCGYPHYSWLTLCRMVAEGLVKRREECLSRGPCSQSGCRQLSESLLKKTRLCRPPCDDERRCSRAHSLPSHLQLPEHCPAFLSDSCNKAACPLPHIPFSNINEIFIQKRSALQMFCEQCYTERTLKTEKEKQREASPEIAFSGFCPNEERDFKRRDSYNRESRSPKRRRSRSRSETEWSPKQSIFSRLGGLPAQLERDSRFSADDKVDLKEVCDAEKANSDFFAKNLKELEDEICKMLEEKKSVPLGQIPVTYNQFYKKQLVLADYGFQRGQLVALVAAMDGRLEITGEDKHRVVNLRRQRIVKFSRSTFENNSKKMLQVHGTVKLNNLMKVYSRMFGNQHTLESYGFQTLDDMVKAGEHTFQVLEAENDEKVVKLRIGKKYSKSTRSRSQIKEEGASKKGGGHEQRVVYEQGRGGGGGSGKKEDPIKMRRLEERREIERRVEARRGIKRDFERMREWDEKMKKWDDKEAARGERDRRRRERRSSRESRSESVRSSREEELIEDVVGDPDEQGDLLRIMEMEGIEHR